MGDYDLPELPSDKELGITDEDREALEDLPEERPEMSAEEMSSLLGEMFSPKTASGEEAAPDPKAERKRKKEERKARRKEKRAAKALAAAAPSDAAVTPTTSAPLPPRRRWRGPVSLAFLIIVGVFASTKTGLPGPVPANAPDTAFSSSRAMSVLIEIATTPHPTGSPEHTRVREFLVERLRLLGLEPEVQTTTAMSPSAAFTRLATVRNVVARLPGTEPTGAILVMAHYDSRELAPGAGDDGSGVVTILEAIRALRAGPPLRNDVIVLFTDGEELGLIGVRAFLDEHRWMQDVSLALTFEMRGAGGPSIMVETNDDNGWVVRALRDAEPQAFANSISDEVYQRMPNFTDFTVLKEAGVQGLMFGAIDNAHVYHQASDAPDQLNESTLQHHGLHALGLLRYLGAADLSNVNAPSVVAFNLPFVGLVVHGQGWVLPLTGATLLALIGATLIAVRQGARVWALFVGLGIAVVGVVSAYGIGVKLLSWLVGRHAEAGSLSGSLFHSEGWYMLSLACAALAIVTTLHAIARRWLSLPELALGAVVIPVAAAAWLSWSMPLGAPNLQWPALAAVLSIVIVSVLGGRAEAAVGWVTTMLLAVPALTLLVPLTELLWISMTFRLAGALAVLMVTVLLLVLPALDALRHPNSWWAPMTALALGGGTLGLGLLAASSNADRPAPSTLVYAFEHGSPEGIWATNPVTDSVDVPARDWAVGRARAAFGTRVSLADYGYGSTEVPAATAPPIDAPPPSIVIQSDTTVGAFRLVTLGVRSRIGAEMVRFQSDDRGETRLRSLNGKAIEDGLQAVEHWGVPDTMIVVELEIPAGSAIGLDIVEHLLRPEELLGEGTFQRPVDLTPDVSWMSDRAMIKTSFLPDLSPEDPTAPPDARAAPSVDSLGATPDTVTVEPDRPGVAPDTIRP